MLNQLILSQLPVSPCIFWGIEVEWGLPVVRGILDLQPKEGVRFQNISMLPATNWKVWFAGKFNDTDWQWSKNELLPSLILQERDCWAMKIFSVLHYLDADRRVLYNVTVLHFLSHWIRNIYWSYPYTRVLLKNTKQRCTTARISISLSHAIPVSFQG